MVIPRSGPPNSQRDDYMATAAKPPPAASSSASLHHSSTAPTTNKRQPAQLYQKQRGITDNHQSTLHDFPFPVLKNWGRQQLLRCAKIPPDHNEEASVVRDRRFTAPSPPPHRTKLARVKDDGMEKIREKLTGHLSEAAGRMRFKNRPAPTPSARRSEELPTSGEDEEDDKESAGEEDQEDYPDTSVGSPCPVAVAPLPPPPPAPAAVEEEKPWKQRVRRSTDKRIRTPDTSRRRGDSSESAAASSADHAPPAAAAAATATAAAPNPAQSLRLPGPPAPPRSLRAKLPDSCTPEEENPTAEEDQLLRAVLPRRSRQQPPRQSQQQHSRKPFSVTLSKEEIEEDVYALTGRRASRRPKKRPRTLRRKLDMLVPGYYLSEVTASQYEVREPPRES